MNQPSTDKELKIALQFAAGQKLAVLSTVSPKNEPESALMGIAVTPEFEIIFHTSKASRKYGNLVANPKAAFVIGCSGAISVQCEGLAEELSGAELERRLKVYFAVFPDAKEGQSKPGTTYFVVRPKWLRYGDYGQMPPCIREFVL
jgi:general stress protein 26